MTALRTNTGCFTFFGKWYDIIKNLEESFGTNEQAYKLFTAIAEYSLYQIQPEFTDEFIFLQAMWPVFEEQIDSSVANRSKHFEDENRKAKEQYVVRLCIEHPDASVRDIATMTRQVPGMKLGKTAVNDIRNRHMEEILAGRRARMNSSAPAFTPNACSDSGHSTDPCSDPAHSTSNNSCPNPNPNSGQDKTDSNYFGFGRKSEEELMREAKELEDNILEKYGDIDGIEGQIEKIHSYEGTDEPGILKWHLNGLLNKLKEKEASKGYDEES